VVDRPPEECDEKSWETLLEDQKPSLTKADPDVTKDQVKQAIRWKKFEKTGVAPESSDEEDDDAGAA
jgi:hypothetical protein